MSPVQWRSVSSLPENLHRRDEVSYGSCQASVSLGAFSQDKSSPLSYSAACVGYDDDLVFDSRHETLVSPRGRTAGALALFQHRQILQHFLTVHGRIHSPVDPCDFTFGINQERIPRRNLRAVVFHGRSVLLDRL